jgi:hypothetical protein
VSEALIVRTLLDSEDPKRAVTPLPVTIHQAGVVTSVRVQEVTAPLPTVMVPLVSFPLILGDDPQAVTAGVLAEVPGT